MAERMTTRSDAALIRGHMLASIEELERSGYTRAEIGAAMVGIGGGIVAAHMGVQKAVAVLDSARDAALASEPHS